MHALQRYKPARAAQLMESVSRAFAQQLSLCLEDTVRVHHGRYCTVRDKTGVLLKLRPLLSDFLRVTREGKAHLVDYAQDCIPFFDRSTPWTFLVSGVHSTAVRGRACRYIPWAETNYPALRIDFDALLCMPSMAGFLCLMRPPALLPTTECSQKCPHQATHSGLAKPTQPGRSKLPYFTPCMPLALVV